MKMKKKETTTNNYKHIILVWLIILTSSAFCQKRSITPVIPRTIEHTQTYKIMEEYGFSTQEYPGEYTETVYFDNAIRLSQDKGDVVYAYFLTDNGEECILKKSFFPKAGAIGYGELMPQEINITDKIKYVLSGYEEDSWEMKDVLKQSLMLIEVPEDDKNFGSIDFLLFYNDAESFFGIPMTVKELLPIEKDSITDFNELATEYAGKHTEWKWYL